MEDQSQGRDTNSPSQRTERNSEPVRTRWTPKPEQILILESIFNSGMVNPPKDETVRIRKLLEKFGAVGDANVFYWFQNRRSRSRRRQRQIQASLAEEQFQAAQAVGAGAIQSHETGSSAGAGGVFPSPISLGPSISQSSSSSLVGSSSSGGVVGEDGVDNYFSFSGQMSLQEIEHNSSMASILCPGASNNLQYQPGYITVFINGVATEVPRGPIDMKAMFGEDVMLVHLSGIPVPFNEFGFSLQSLQPGESYFLVSKSS
ncbi:hypothetical protein NMG60_11001184 [Bertholletia excelsa]